MSETFTFQAETQQLLDILVHSLYTEREIFLRELVSNASDALNRMQFEQLTNQNVMNPDLELRIAISVDEEAGTLTISDTGVGMTRDDMIENLGTIARSGAKRFIEAMKEAPNKSATQDIIGQFGVGFYSVFMVADKVRVVSRSFQPDAEAVAWEADGGTSYRIEAAEREERGTDITIYLNEEAKQDFTQEWQIKNTIQRHSNYVTFPIYVGEAENPVNDQQAIWRQAPAEIEEDTYNNFYRMMTMDFGEPLHRIHMRADVPLQFYALLFVPSSGEQNMFSLRKEPGLKLYARKVLIQEYNKDLLPEYLQFVQGVVDSEDLPLNVSRESVRADRIIARLRTSLKNRVLGDLKKMAAKNHDEKANDGEQDNYLNIYKQFGRFLKQGLVAAPEDRDDLTQLLLFNTTLDDDENTWYALDEYVGRMAEGQNEIYYIMADDFTSARRSPHLDAFRQRGIEVLYFTDPVDPVIPMGLSDYKGYKLRSVDESDIDLRDVGTTPADEPQEATEPLPEDTFGTLQERVKNVLGGRVSDVRESKTLVGSPARLVSTDGGAQRHMFRINRLLDREFELPVKTLELNPRHPLMHNLVSMMQANPGNQLIDVAIEQVFETALLQDGIHPDPAAMAERLNLLLQAATGSAADALNFGPVAPQVVSPPENDDNETAG